MARPQYPSDKQDQFMLRLPDGLRGRIKAAADKAGRSMNAEIVLLLAEKYPEPLPLEGQVEEMLDLVEILKFSVDESSVHKLTDHLFQTLNNIAEGRVPGVSDDVRASVKDRLGHWQIDRWEDDAYRASRFAEGTDIIDEAALVEKRDAEDER